MKALQSIGADRVAIGNDSTLTCASMIGLSAFPSGTFMHMTAGRMRALVVRMLGAITSALALPFCVAENKFFRRPGAGLVFAHKSGSLPLTTTGNEP